MGARGGVTGLGGGGGAEREIFSIDRCSITVLEYACAAWVNSNVVERHDLITSCGTPLSVFTFNSFRVGFSGVCPSAFGISSKSWTKRCSIILEHNSTGTT